MTQVRIAGWHTHYRSKVPLPSTVRQSWDGAISELSQSTMLDGLVADDWVLVRRVELAARWDVETTDAGVRDRTGRALRFAVEKMLDREHPDVLRYEDERDALADFLYRALSGDVSRAWAWYDLGWLPTVRARSTLVSKIDWRIASAAAVVALRDRPTLIFPVLARLAAAQEATGALTWLFSRLPAEGWSLLLSACPQTQAFVAPPGPDLVSSPTEATSSPANRAVALTPLARQLLAWAAGNPNSVRGAWSPLCVWLAGALTPPGSTPRPGAQELQAAALLAAQPPFQVSSAVRPRESEGEQSRLAPPAAPAKPAGPAGRARDERQPEPPTADAAAPASTRHVLESALPLPAPAAARPTEWGGVLFLLQLLPRTQLLLRLEELAASSDLPHILQHISRASGVPASDPATSAFAGGFEPDAAQLDERGLPQLSRAVQRVLEQTLESIEAWLAQHAPDLEEPRLETVARRSGLLAIEPGLVTLSLPLDGVDLRLRRVGLDLDPGFVPWLRAVVRFHYV